MDNNKCMVCNKGLRPIKTIWGNPSYKQKINDWKGRTMHKSCWLENKKRNDMIDYLKHRDLIKNI